MFDQFTELDEMTPSRVSQAVLEAKQVLCQCHVDRRLRAKSRNTANIDVADLVSSGYEWLKWCRGVRLNILTDLCPGKACAKSVEGTWRRGVPVLEGQKLNTRDEGT